MIALRKPAGFSMLMAMLIVAVSTLLVMGAISFTGNERLAASSFERRAAMSACSQAARNLFLARTRLLNVNSGGPYALDPSRASYNEARGLDAGLVLSATGDDSLRVTAQHYSATTDAGTVTYSVTEAPAASIPDQDTNAGTVSLTNKLGGRGASGRAGGSGFAAKYYTISALCTDGEGGPEQEVEFTVRLGF